MGNGALFGDKSKGKVCGTNDLQLSGKLGSVATALACNSPLQYKPINNELRKDCEFCWTFVENNMTTGGVGEFCRIFFANFSHLDPENSYVHKFKPKTNSTIMNRNHLFVRVVKYLLSISSEKFKVKAKIRHLGRCHATRGIVEEHFRAFSQAFELTLVAALGTILTPDLLLGWKSLLQFTVEQLIFDKITLVPHCTPSMADDVSVSDGNSTPAQDIATLLYEDGDMSSKDSESDHTDSEATFDPTHFMVPVVPALALAPVTEDTNEDAVSRSVSHINSSIHLSKNSDTVNDIRDRSMLNNNNNNNNNNVLPTLQYEQTYRDSISMGDDGVSTTRDDTCHNKTQCNDPAVCEGVAPVQNISVVVSEDCLY